MAQLTVSAEEHFRSLPILGQLSRPELASLAHLSRFRECRKNQDLFRSGDPVDRLLVVTRGWVKVYIETDDGVNLVTSMSSRHAVLGLSEIFGETPKHSLSAQVVENAELFEIPAAAVKKMAILSADFLTRIIEDTHHKLLLQVEYKQMMALSAAQRVAWLLLRLSTHMVGNGGSFPFPYNKAAAASELGMSPETFSRALASLTEAGLLNRSSDIEIEDFGNLREFLRTGKNNMGVREPVPRQGTLSFASTIGHDRD